MAPRGKKAKAPDGPTDFPPLDWTASEFALTYQMLEILEHYDRLRQTIWFQGGESATGMTKSDAYRDIAAKLLQQLPPYTEYVGDAASPGAKHYGSMIKGKITKLQEQYQTAKERLGVTGAGLPTEEFIWKGSDLMKTWDAVKWICPYFYQLKVLIGGRTAVSNHAITNSGTGIGGIDFMARGEFVTEDTEDKRSNEVEDDDEFPLDPKLGTRARLDVSLF